MDIKKVQILQDGISAKCLEYIDLARKRPDHSDINLADELASQVISYLTTQQDVKLMVEVEGELPGNPYPKSSPYLHSTYDEAQRDMVKAGYRKVITLAERIKEKNNEI